MEQKSRIRADFVDQLQLSLASQDPLIQVILGPRQVGKTTGVQLFLEEYTGSFHYATADGAIHKGPAWLTEQWATARAKSRDCLLVVDEIQKVEQWSEELKALWDPPQNRLPVIVLGSSSMSIQVGLSESLAGRYQLHKVWPWNENESREGYGLCFEQFLTCGGYPGSYRFVSPSTSSPGAAWVSYLRESIIDAVIGHDILSEARVKSPSLFRQAFDLACSYGAQEISYTKLLGQLQDRGNTDLVKHYLRLFEDAFLLRELQKYSAKAVRRRSSSPKILPTSPALYSVTLDGELDQEERGRAFEIAVGCLLLRKPGRLYYWRERNDEVDYVYVHGKAVTAIEVKSGRRRRSSALSKFRERFAGSTALLVTPETYKSAIEEL